jgi:hypothetical protein
MSWTDEQLTDMFGDDPVGKLAFLTGCYKHSINNSPYDGWIISDDNLRKFAELIVKECIDQISVNHDPNSDWDWEVSRGHAIAIIKEHFGVE